jgi:hypothetical protein
MTGMKIDKITHLRLLSDSAEPTPDVECNEKVLSDNEKVLSDNEKVLFEVYITHSLFVINGVCTELFYNNFIKDTAFPAGRFGVHISVPLH